MRANKIFVFLLALKMWQIVYSGSGEVYGC